MFCLSSIGIGAAQAEVHQASSVMESFFTIETVEDGSRVASKREMPTSMWQRACRYGLTQPLRNEVRDDLSVQLGTPVPREISYAEVRITDFRSWREGDWLYCRGEVEELDRDHNLAALSIRVAWDYSLDPDEALLRSLLKLGLSDDRTRDDAIVLIAANSPAESAFAYLEQHLNTAGIKLEQSRIKAMELYLEQKRYDEVIALGEGCREARCDALFNSAEIEKSSSVRSEIKDISNFFK